MKLTVADFKKGLVDFEAKLVDSQSTKMNKFAMGVALAGLNQGTDKMLAKFIGADGMVDAGLLRSYVSAGMKAAGMEDGESALEIVPEIDPALRLVGVTIKNIKLTKDDLEEFFEKTLPAVVTSAEQ